jgi:hypothetical protein
MLSRIVLAALLYSATPARADVLRIVRPRPAAPAAGQAGTPSLLRNAGTAPECFDAQGKPIVCGNIDMTYFGGHVLSNVKVYAVFWDATVRSDVALGMGGFYRALTNSEYLDWLTEYSTTLAAQAGSHLGQPGTQQVIGRGSFAGSYTLASLSRAYPACAAPNATLTCLTDADITAELEWQVVHGHLPAHDANALYMMHFPASIRIIDTTGATLSCKVLCAYHGTYRSAGQSVFYAVLPDLGSNGCQTGCGAGTVFENTCSAASHELAESITDAEVGLDTGTSADFPLGWYDNETASQGEIGDMCNQHTDTVGADGLTGCAPVDAGCYPVQQVFSRAVWNADPAGHPGTLACVAARYDASDFSVALQPNTLTLATGATSPSLAVVTTLTNGSPLALALSVTDLPAGLHANLDTTSLTVGGAAHLSVSADANAPLLKDGVLVLRATGTGGGGAATHSAALLVQVVLPTNDWSLAVGPATATLLPGASQLFTVSGQVTSGSPEPVSLSSAVSGLPPGVTATFNPSTLTPGASTSALTLSAAASAPGAGPSLFTVTGTSAAQPGGHSAAAQLQVDTPPTVSITSPTAGATVAGVVSIQVAAAPGANTSLASLSIAVDANPPLSSGTASSASWDTRTVSNGGHTLNVKVVDADGASASAALSVTVTNSDFTLGLSPAAVVLSPGTHATLSVTTAVASGSAEAVSLSVVGLPPGVQGTFVPAQVTAGGTSTLMLVAPPGTAGAPASLVTVTGTSASRPAGHSATAQLQVDTPPTVSITSPTAGATVAGVVAVQVAAAPGANTSLASFSFAVDGNSPLSSGTASSASWDTRTVSNGAHFLSVQVVDGDGLDASATVSVTVTNNDFTLLLAPAQLALSVGGSAALTLTTAVASGSAELVSLSVTGLPPGVQGTFAPAQVTAGGTSTLTLVAPTGTASAPASTVTVRGTSASRPGGHSATASLSVSMASSGCSSAAGGDSRWLLAMVATSLLCRRRRPPKRR